jgi:hypothetical protein
MCGDEVTPIRKKGRAAYMWVMSYPAFTAQHTQSITLKIFS